LDRECGKFCVLASLHPGGSILQVLFGGDVSMRADTSQVRQMSNFRQGIVLVSFLLRTP
jgi:hypothetical protein